MYLPYNVSVCVRNKKKLILSYRTKIYIRIYYVCITKLILLRIILLYYVLYISESLGQLIIIVTLSLGKFENQLRYSNNNDYIIKYSTSIQNFWTQANNITAWARVVVYYIVMTCQIVFMAFYVIRLHDGFEVTFRNSCTYTIIVYIYK
jgi:hypothetical protein